MLNNLPKNWEWKKLGEVCDVKKGTSITKQKTQIGDIPVIAGGQQPAYYHNVANRTGKTIILKYRFLLLTVQPFNQWMKVNC